jgi:hypothetical protein
LKPFVFLDLIDNQGKPFSGFGLHPHSGIATLTYVAEGSVRYEDTNGATGLLRWDRLSRLVERWIPVARVLHPYPMQRFDATHPRREPYA